MDSVDIITISPHYCYNKCVGTRKGNFYFDVGDERFHLFCLFLGGAIFVVQLPNVWQIMVFKEAPTK